MCMSCKPAMIKRKGASVYRAEPSNFTVNFCEQSQPHHKACWEVWLLAKVPANVQRTALKILQGLKMKFESRNKSSNKADSTHSCRLSLLLKRYHQNIPQSWMGTGAVDQQITALINLFSELHSIYG